ncbi:hypothetical protein Pfo_004656, partial [Paulownia fortunei]
MISPCSLLHGEITFNQPLESGWAVGRVLPSQEAPETHPTPKGEEKLLRNSITNPNMKSRFKKGNIIKSI